MFKPFSLKSQTVISIGNLVVGGSGKTPMVITVSKLLGSLKIKHGVVSRGYGRKLKKDVVVADGNSILSNVTSSGDEPFLLAKALPKIPIVVGDKKRGIVRLLDDFKIKTVLIDDGFQTFKLKKTVEIVLVDLSSSLDDFFIFPLGRLREPLSALKRANVVIFTKKNKNNIDELKIKKLFSPYLNTKKMFVFESVMKNKLFKFNSNTKKIVQIGLQSVDDSVLCFCGISNPRSFVASSNSVFKNIKKFISFKDHFCYTKSDIRKIEKIILNKNISGIVTTMKDFVKVQNYFSHSVVYVLDVEHIIKDENRFVLCLNNFIKKT